MGVGTLMLLREANVGDASDIGAVHAEAWRVAYRDLFESDFLSDQVESRRARWPHVMAQPAFANSTLLVAERGSRVAAFAHLGPAVDRDNCGEIYACCAHPSVWGTGVASALMSETLQILAESGFRQVRSWTISGLNRARRFFLKSGFRESSRTRESDFGDGRPVLELEYVRSIRNFVS
jgi:GNAT superfamily N-acetyltransferase